MKTRHIVSRRRRARPASSLRPADFEVHPIWRFVEGDEPDETWVLPVSAKCVTRLSGKIVGTQATLADGSRRWAVLSNVDHENVTLTEHFLCLSLFVKGRWFHLARYHDIDATKNGPRALAAVLGRPVTKVFPIHYDLRPYLRQAPSWLSGTIERSPRKRFTRAQIIALAVPRL